MTILKRKYPRKPLLVDAVQEIEFRTTLGFSAAHRLYLRTFDRQVRTVCRLKLPWLYVFTRKSSFGQTQYIPPG